MWKTEPAPASFTLFGFPDLEARTTRDAVRVPWVLGLIATRSLDEPVPGIENLVDQNRARVESGILADKALMELRANPADAAAKAALAAHVKDLGYGLLVKRYTGDITKATPSDIDKAAWSTVPDVLPLFWSFRVMVALGFFFVGLFALAFWLSARRRLERYRAFLWIALFSLPLPWIAAELGWFVAEYGRQPWTIDGVLPTFLSVSSVPAHSVLLSLMGFILFYSALAVVEIYLMVKYIRLGPTPATGAPAARALAAAGE
jgi:cytochrome d ubiquinol oxidase subunit I